MKTSNVYSVCKNGVSLVFLLPIRYSKLEMASFLKIWSKMLRCKSMMTPLAKKLVIKTKLLVLFLTLVIMLYPVMHERRTIDALHQMSSMQWQPTILIIKFWSFARF